MRMYQELTYHRMHIISGINMVREPLI
jgi:hypothetical protein